MRKIIFDKVGLSVLCCLLASVLAGQQPLDFGVHIGPELAYINSQHTPSGFERNVTNGDKGYSFGFVSGAYLEYEVLPNLSVRGGINYARKRYEYAVSRGLPEQNSVSEGTNRIVFTTIELPVAVIYRFNYLPNNDRILIGLGGVVDRWVGDPQVETPFISGSRERDYIDEAHQSVKGFLGYEHYLSNRFVVGLEPYLAYTPTRFRFETETVSRVFLEAGLSVRLRFDN